MVSFDTEESLVAAFMAGLSACHTVLRVQAMAREFPSRHGRADIVSISEAGDVVAFEVKLTRWRDALAQAYRNTSFAHRSYVVLPWSTAQRAGQFIGEFERRGVGLCTLTDGEVRVIQDAIAVTPLLPWLSSAAARTALSGGGLVEKRDALRT